MIPGEPTIQERLACAKPVDIWPDPIPLRDELPPVARFEAELLPSRLRSWVADIAERMNCPMDLVALPAMIAAGSLIGRRVGIRPQRRTPWLEVGNLWGCVVARPGSLKSPAAAEALAPLRKLEARAAEEYRAAVRENEAAEALFKLEREAAEKAARAALNNKAKDSRDRAKSAFADIAKPETPVERRHLTSDVTAEKLGEICAANPHGIMVHRDELLSLFADLDYPEKASARGFFMTGWSGLEGYTFDRILRGTVRVSAVNISIYGTTQPGRLAAYIRQSVKRFDDGMVQRLQLLAWPDFEAGFQEVDRYPDIEARRIAHECYSELGSLDPRQIGAGLDEDDGSEAVPFLRFSDEAQENFAAWRASLELKVRSDDLSTPLRQHLSKYRGLIPRLALVCHLASDGFGPVSPEATIRALRWAEYLETHAHRAYASTTVDNAEAARAIWRRVRKRELPASFTAREIERKGWSGLNDRERVSAGLAALVDADWLRASRTDTGGRPTTIYQPNPKALDCENAVLRH